MKKYLVRWWFQSDRKIRGKDIISLQDGLDKSDVKEKGMEYMDACKDPCENYIDKEARLQMPNFRETNFETLSVNWGITSIKEIK